MSLRIPLNLPVPVRVDPDVQALRAVAAATALADAARALKVVKETRENPGDSIGKADKAQIKPILEAIVAVRGGTRSAPVPTENQSAVARAIDANPTLVAAAFPLLDKPAAPVDSSLQWVASIDVDLLERAATAAARETLFEFIPDQQARLDALEKTLASREQRLDALEKTLASGEQRQDGFDTDLAELKARVGQLESGRSRGKSTGKAP